MDTLNLTNLIYRACVLIDLKNNGTDSFEKADQTAEKDIIEALKLDPDARLYFSALRPSPEVLADPERLRIKYQQTISKLREKYSSDTICMPLADILQKRLDALN